MKFPALSVGSFLVGYTALRIVAVHVERSRAVQQMAIQTQASFPPPSVLESLKGALQPSTYFAFWQIPSELGLVGPGPVGRIGSPPCVECSQRMLPAVH